MLAMCICLDLGSDASSAVAKKRCADAQHTEEADTNLLTGAPAAGPDLAEILTGPVASALDGDAPADIHEASKEPLRSAHPPDQLGQAAQAGPALGRKGRASGLELATGQSNTSASAKQQAATKPTRQRASKASSLASIAEEDSAPKKHDSLQPKQERSTWGGGRRKRTSDSAALSAAAPASDAALPVAEQEQGPAREPEAVTTTVNASKPIAERQLRSRLSAKQDNSHADAEPELEHASAAPDATMPTVRALCRRLPLLSAGASCC